MLHGYGSNEEDLFGFASELPEQLTIISVRAPYPMQPYGNAWYAINFDNEKGKWSDNKQAVLSRDKIVVFIKEACETYKLDQSKVSLLGFSQGTILSYAVALSYPDKIKNVMALSGYINEDILKDDFVNGDFSNLSIYASHGRLDQVIPALWAQKAAPFLEKLGVEHTYHEFSAGHGVAPENLQSLKKWIKNRI